MPENGELLTIEQLMAIEAVSKAQGWDRKTTADIRLLLWCLFHYYVRRLR